MKASLPLKERQRLDALRRCHILDTPPEPCFEDVTLLAAQVCEAPMAAISCVDEQRQWFKSVVGLGMRQTPRDASFCAQAILHPNAPLIVEDALRDERFANNPLVTQDPFVRFYAGVPLVLPDGNALGALCVLDLVPRRLREGQVQSLMALARQVVTYLVQRKNSHVLANAPVPFRDSPTTFDWMFQFMGSMGIGFFFASGSLNRITAGNQALADLLEANDPSKLEGSLFRDLFAIGADCDRFIDHLIHEHRMVAEEFTLRTLSGHPVRVLLTAAAEKTHKGVQIVGVVQDITGARAAERDRDRFFNLAQDMLCFTGMDGRFKSINPAFTRSVGYSEDQLLGKHCLDFVHAEDLPHTMMEVLKLAHGGETTNFANRFRCKNGEYMNLVWAVTPFPDENRVFAIARDVSERVRAEKDARALHASRVEDLRAREIQRSLMPRDAPVVPGFEITARLHPVGTAGGDYYDYIPGPGGRLFLAIGDVSGHSVASSVLMAEVRTCLWNILPHCATPAEALRRTNALLHSSIPEGYFVTLALIEMNTRTGAIRYASCGHPACIVLSPSGEILARLESSGLPLGCFPDCRVQCEGDLRIPPGGTLMCLTDGLLEARSTAGEFFEEDRVLDVIRANHHKPAAEVLDKLIEAVRAFCGGEQVQDDVTAMLVRRAPAMKH